MARGYTSQCIVPIQYSMPKKSRTSRLPIPQSLNGHHESNKLVLEAVDGPNNKAAENETCLSARELQAMLDREKENNRNLREQLRSQEHQIEFLEKELTQNLEKSASCSIVALSEELFAKDAIIRDLEELHKKVLEYNRNIFTLLSTVFKTCGLAVSEEEMQVSLTTGRVQFISDMLLSALEEHGGKSTSDAWSQIEQDESGQNVSSLPSTGCLVRLVPNMKDDSDEDLKEDETLWEPRILNGVPKENVSDFHHEKVVKSLQINWKNEDIMDLFNVLENNRRSLLLLEHKLLNMERSEKMKNPVKNNAGLELLKTILSGAVNEEK